MHLGWVKERKVFLQIAEEYPEFVQANPLLHDFLEFCTTNHVIQMRCVYCRKTLTNKRPNAKFCNDSHRASYYSTGSPEKHHGKKDFGGLLNKTRESLQWTANKINFSEYSEEIHRRVSRICEWIKTKRGFYSLLKIEREFPGTTFSLLKLKDQLEKGVQPEIDKYDLWTAFLKKLNLSIKSVNFEKSVENAVGSLIFSYKCLKVDFIIQKEIQILRSNERIEQTNPLPVEKPLSPENRVWRMPVQHKQHNPVDPEVLRIRETLRKTIFSA